jgi:hypothetical protein
MTNEECLERLQRLSDQHGISIVEIANIAWAIVSAELDPIEATGEDFVFQTKRPRREPFGSSEDDYDLNWINRDVPAPDARVDLIVALQQYQTDTLRGDRIIAGNSMIEDVVRVNNNQRAWFRFWAVRHQSPAMRAKYKEFLESTELMHQRNKAGLRRLRA